MGKSILAAVVTVGFMVSVMTAKTAFAAGDEGKNTIEVPVVQNQEDRSVRPVADQSIPAQAGENDRTYKDIQELQEKYGSTRMLPEGKSCSSEELAECFIGVLRKVVEKYEREGPRAIQRDDMESARGIIVSLEDVLFHKTEYLQIRRTIERLLAPIETAVPVFKYKVGVNGFLRGEGVNNFSLPDLSYSPGHGEGRFVYRVKPYGYWHPNDYLDIHLEGQGYGYKGGSHQEYNKASVYQGFVEAKLPNSGSPGKNYVALKAGRQEFVYGSAFMVGSDTFFDGLTFDAVRLRVQPQSTLSLDLLGGGYVGPFSDETKGNLVGAYLTYQPSEDSSLEIYGFRDTGSAERRDGEHLDIQGFRSTSSVGIYAVEYEVVYESGKLFNPATGENEGISAIGGHVDLAREFKLFGLDNTIILGFAIGSGDKDAANGVRSNREFRNPNNDSPIFGDMHVVGDLSGVDVGDHHASGLQISTLGWGMELNKKTNISATGHKFMAGSVEDGFSRDIGLEADLSLTYELNKDYSLIVAYDHFFPGQFFREASGSNKGIDYAYTMLVYNYDWTRRKR